MPGTGNEKMKERRLFIAVKLLHNAHRFRANTIESSLRTALGLRTTESRAAMPFRSLSQNCVEVTSACLS
jgi:hypothetical protein